MRNLKADTFHNMLLCIRDLNTWFYTKEGIIKAVNGIDLEIAKGESLGLVGESGSGKSVTALSILRLISPPGRIVRGKIEFLGRDLLKLPLKAMYSIRGREISMIFQEPMTALNPVFTVGRQIAEIYQHHLGLSKRQALERTIEMLKLVRIPSPEVNINAYPHQLSGGMRQRVMIAIALACRPRLLIADEPTTALDVTVQAQILRLMDELKRQIGTSILFISHNLSVVAQIANRIAVMYAGKIIEIGILEKILESPAHPYTRGLLAAIPKLGDKRERHLEAIPGSFEKINSAGCVFAPRCKEKMPICLEKGPALKKVSADHLVACWQYG